MRPELVDVRGRPASGPSGLRVLYDAYHMQVMEGDLLRTIKENLELIGHIHTAGVPGRRDLDDRQEVNWAAVGGLLSGICAMRAGWGTSSSPGAIRWKRSPRRAASPMTGHGTGRHRSPWTVVRAEADLGWSGGQPRAGQPEQRPHVDDVVFLEHHPCLPHGR